MRQGVLRQDFYYRLNTFQIEIPPLRSRVEDVAPLARQFVSRFAAKQGISTPQISTDVMQRLSAYHWPGNIRELQNMIERGVVANPDGPIGLESLVPFRFRNPPPTAGRKSGTSKGRATKVSTSGGPAALLFDTPPTQPPTIPTQVDLTLPMTQLSPTSSGPGSDVAPVSTESFRSLADLEREHIIRVMEHARNDVARAAEILKLTPARLRERLRSLWD